MTFTQIYAPPDSSGRTLEDYTNFLEDVSQSTRRRSFEVFMGDWNATMGEETEDRNIGRYGYGLWNERGESLHEFCVERRLDPLNNFYKRRSGRRWTHMGPNGVRRNIDWILGTKSARRIITRLETLNFTPSDHKMLRIKLRINISRRNFKPRTMASFVVKRNVVESLLRINPPEGNWTDVALKLREVTAATKVEEKEREDSEGQVIREARLRRRMIKERFNRGDESLEALKEASKSIREMMEAKMRRRREETLIRALETGKLKKGARSMTKMEEEEGIIDEEGREVWLDKEKAEVIAKYLGMIYKSRSERKPAEPEAKSEVDEEWITEEEVRWAASKIRSGAASGHDLIHSAVVKFGTDVIVKQLRDSINNMFNTGEFP